MKKIIALSLAIITVLLAFASCVQNNAVDTSDTSDANSVVLIEKGKKTDYMVIYADDVGKSVIGVAKGVAYQLSEKFDVEVECYAEQADWGCPYESEHEILIGNTTRDESAEAMALLKGAGHEYAIKLFDNGNIAIVGSSNQALEKGVNYFLSTFITENKTEVLKMEKGYNHYDTDNSSYWKLNVPEYLGGVIAKAAYQTGYNGSFAEGSNGGMMQTVTETSAEEFKEYVDTLKASGYTVTGENTIGKNIYYQLKNNSSNKLVYTYYLDNFKEARIIHDYVSVAEPEFEYTYKPQAGETAAIYQYGMMYDPTGAGGTITTNKPYENNGATVIIRMSDNSLVLIDGGRPNQASEAATEGLMNFLYEITGVDKNGTEKIRIAAVFFSHGDGDHLNFVYSLLRNEEYVKRLQVERVMHNFPGRGYDRYFPEMGKLLYQSYSNVKFMKLHTGQKIQLADATFEIVYTHEDMVDASTGKLAIDADGNLLTTIFKLTLNGKTFLAMGDWGADKASEAKYLNMYDACEKKLLGMYDMGGGKYPFLECDILQVAHHAINSNNAKVHAAVKADYAFFSQQDVAYEQLTHVCYTDIVDQLEAAGMHRSHMYFAGRQTNWLTIAQNGTITHGHKKIEGVDEERYWYTDDTGALIYKDVMTGNYNTKEIGVPASDKSGSLVQELTEAGFTGVKAVKMKGYWDLLNTTKGKDGKYLTPFWPANNT